VTPADFAASLVGAFATGDVEGYFAHFDPDATFLFHDTPGRLESRAAYEAQWAQWERDHGFRVAACTSSNQRVQEYDGLAVFTHDVHTVRIVDGVEDAVDERETIVLRRSGESWTCVHEHLSPAPA
jgi:ketosteroid isomerase-like protein